MSDTPSTTAGELAGLCGGSLTDSAGLADKAIRRVATVQEAGGDAVTWIGDEKYAKLLAECRAGVVIGTEALLGDDRRGIIVADPALAIAKVLDWFLTPNEPPPPGIHPAAVVHEAAILGSNVRVGAWAMVAADAVIGDETIIHEGVSVGRAVKIGRECRIYGRCVVYDRCEIGDRVIVHAGTVIGADGFGYIFREGRHRRLAHVGLVIIEDDVEIGANVCIDRAKTGATRIGCGSKIDNLVQIAHNVRLGPSCVIVAHVALAGSARLGMGVVMGGHSGIGENVTVGDGVRVGAQSSVMRDVAAGGVVIGTPARDRTAVLRDQARVHNLPKWFAEIAELQRRVAELEAAADSQEHG